MFRSLVICSMVGLLAAAMLLSTGTSELPGATVTAAEANQVIGGVCGDWDNDDCDWLNFCTATTCFVCSSAYHDFSGDATLPGSCGANCYTYYQAIDESACGGS